MVTGALYSATSEIGLAGLTEEQKNCSLLRSGQGYERADCRVLDNDRRARGKCASRVGSLMGYRP